MDEDEKFSCVRAPMGSIKKFIFLVFLFCFTAEAFAQSWVPFSKPDDLTQFYVDENSLKAEWPSVHFDFKIKYSTPQEKLWKKFDLVIGKGTSNCNEKKWKVTHEKWYYNNDPNPVWTYEPFSFLNPLKEAEASSIAGTIISVTCGEKGFAKIKESYAGLIPKGRSPSPAISENQSALPNQVPSHQSLQENNSSTDSSVSLAKERKPDKRDEIGFEKIYYREPTSEFPVKIEWGNVPNEVASAISKKELSQQKSKFIVLNINGMIDRKISDKSTKRSTIILGKNRVPNPEYQSALIEYQHAMSAYNQGIQQNSLNPPAPGWAAALSGLANIGLAANVNSAKNKLLATPQYIAEDVRQGYDFSVTNIQSNRIINGEIILIDPKIRSIQRFPFKDVRPKNFKIPSGIDPRDTGISAKQRAYDSERDIDAWENENFVIDVNQLLDQVTSKAPLSRASYKSTDALVKLITTSKDKNKYQTQKRSPTSEHGISDDHRFEGVVVVSAGSGMGTGFFILPNVIITNEHVVSDSSLAEIKLFNGKNIVGKVYKKDINRDLALIRVSEHGKPLPLIDRPIQIGATVDVIGHPKGLGYSLSRGVVSGIRKLNNSETSAVKPVKFIQTDAAINPGNSGGPMFINHRVAGVNTQKLSGKGGVEGIGFAIHVDEIKEFMRD